MSNEATPEDLLGIVRSIARGDTPALQYGDPSARGPFDRILEDISPVVAFELLTEICPRVRGIATKSHGYIGAYVQLLELLARASETTELPTGMLDVVQRLGDAAAPLRRWYRLEG